MRRLATITAFALALTVLPFSLASASTASPSLAGPSTTSAPATPQWQYYGEYPMPWICQYVGNQVVAAGSYQAYTCLAGSPGEIALWVLTY
jgi:hypothetical protein